MTEEREISGFALTFVTGIMSVMIIPLEANILFPSICISAIIISTIHLKKHRSDIIRSYCCLAMMAFAAGVICMATSRIISSDIQADTGLIGGICRRFCKDTIRTISSIPFSSTDTTSIITALLTGDKSLLTDNMVSAFSRSGASHILALSGLHLGIIYGIIRKLSWIAGGTPLAKRATSLINIALCGAYTAAVGAGASIMRAYIFIVIYEAARISHRQATLRHVLPAALIIQLTLYPMAIRSISFQLSYAAMAGIAYIYPFLRRFWPESETPASKFSVRRIWETAALSISCQITTAPLAWYYFKSFPVHFLLSNLIATPLTGAIIPLSILTVILHSMGICPDLLIDTVEGLIGILLNSMTTISSI